ncbi:xanthine dehydrogenase family protein subunit M [Marinilongibacter aquaticus]|uniref:FAD binding domain-containing protein n=1 Tax=Marinilongibacter aquaticus TaxID=2975157 RepID=UPI0021BD1EF8|nr:xanthine dehydrogenase family protein subunit M [Marinilongibacter aquaticus]UBM57424.1 xanthine dehydrogenase family protein subunit M [Marinilongibacter aquaticus]
MIPSSVTYYRAKSIGDALSTLKANPDAKLLAGGHSLVPAMKLRLNSPTMVIDIANVKEMCGIEESEGKIRIGSMATHADILNSAMIQNKLPLLAQTAKVIGDVQVRNMGTIGGSIAHADPAADWPASLLALEAEIVVQREEEIMHIAAEDFFLGFFMTALEESDIVVGIEIDLEKVGNKMAYAKFMQPASRFAIVGCAVNLKVGAEKILEAKVAFTGVADGPFRDKAIEAALAGKAISKEQINEAAQLAASGADSIMEDHYASEEYRRHLAKVYAQRALTAALGL